MTFSERKYLPFIVLFFIVFISRIPFLFPGYGIEEDSWGIALAALHTHASGLYEPSRFPGHPVQELILSALSGYGAILFNLLSAFFSGVAVVFFALILKQLRFQYFFIAALAFAFIPVFYISGTYTIDFAWTEAFVLISFYCMLRNKLIIAGVFLGFAIGCRITSGAMLIPFMLILWEQGNIKENIGKFMKIFFPMLFVTLFAFLPLIRQFGFSFFMYYDQFPYPPITKVLYKMIPGVFGFIGTLALGYALLMIILKRKQENKQALFSGGLNKRIIYAALVIIVLYIISYFRLPQKSGYMIPIIPFLIILLGCWLDSKNFKIICYAFIASSFICSINLTDKLRGAQYSSYAIKFNVSGQEIFFDPLSGPVFSDHSKRQQKTDYCNHVLRKVEAINSKTVIIAGWWYNQLQVNMFGDSGNPSVIYESYIDEAKINDYRAKGYKITYLPEQDLYNDQMFKMNVTDSVAEAFE